ncbi:MAG: MBL fold metallo-hydrolase [Gammaproteobacteria bacterium]
MSSPNHETMTGGITCIDTGYYRPRMAACYLMEHNGQAAFIDSGTAHSVPRLLKLLDHKQIARRHVAYVMPTHVHLDHAGGAGELMHHLPEARLVVHPRGARHMIDPGKLIAGATAVYGETTFRENFGTLRPVPEHRIILAEDGLELDLSGRRLLFMDTPGHARHHYSIFDESTRGFFAGDVFGLSYRESDGPNGAFVFPTTTPVQFDPSAWRDSLDRLLRCRPDRVYMAHYGMVTAVESLANDLRRRIGQLAELAESSSARNLTAEQDRHQHLVAEIEGFLLSELTTAGVPLDRSEALALFNLDIELNAQGLSVWLDRD